MAKILAWVDRRRRQPVAANLARAWPHLPESERETLRNRIYAHFARLICDLGFTLGRRQAGWVLEHSEIRGTHHLSQALDLKRGAILCSAHLGNWEWIPLLLHRKPDLRPCSVARPLDNPLLEKRILEMRQWAGSQILYRQGALRAMLQELEKNGVVYLLLDQNTIAREAVFCQFFGLPAAVNAAAARIHLRRQIPIVPLFLHYEGERVILEFQAPILTAATPPPADPVQTLSQELSDLIAAAIQRQPEQWLWFHDRWRTPVPPSQEN